MPSADTAPVDLRTITPITRPPRIAVGVMGLSHLNWQTILMRRSLTWGAMRNSVVFPLDKWSPGSIWDRVLDRFDPDEILLGTDDQVLGQRMAARYDPMFSFSNAALPHLPSAFEGRSTTDLTTIARARTKEVGNRSSRITRIYDLLSGPQSLQLLNWAVAGCLSEPMFKAMKETGIAHERRQLDPLGKPEDLDMALALAFSPPDDCLSSLNAFRVLTVFEAYSHVDASTQGPIIVCGNATEDICLWLSLRTLRQDDSAFWLPDDLATATPGAAISYQAALFTKLKHFELPQADAPYVTSVTLDATAIKERLTKLIKYGMNRYEIGFDPLTRLKMRPFVSLNRHEGRYRDQFTQGRSHSELRILVPEWIQELNDLRLRFLVEAHVSQVTLPTHPAIHPLVSNPLPEDHRSGRRGVVAEAFGMFAGSGDRIEHVLRHYQLDLPSMDDVMRRLARRLKGNAWPSQNGQLVREVVGRMGGVAEAVRQLNGGELSLVTKALMSNQATPGKYGLSDGRFVADLDFVAATLNLDPKASAADERKLRRLMTEWSEQGTLLWGLALKCPICGYSDYYALHEQQRSGVGCHRCQRDFLPTAATSVRWRLLVIVDEVLRTALDSGGLEEMALCLWLDGDANGLNMTLGTQWSMVGKEVETDVAGTVNGDLVIGEAKGTATFSDLDQIDRLASLADLLDARRLIFATSAPRWAEAAKKRMATARATSPGVRIEAYRDLLQPGGPVADTLAV